MCGGRGGGGRGEVGGRREVEGGGAEVNVCMCSGRYTRACIGKQSVLV